MKKIFVTLAILMMTLSAHASRVAEDCFALSLDGKKISHIVVYTNDYDGQVGSGPIPTIHVRVIDFLDNLITGTTLSEPTTNSLIPLHGYDKYPAKHHISFTQIKLSGQKVSYDIKIDGIAQQIGSGLTIVRGQSEVLIDGKKASFPNLKTVRFCPNPADREAIQEVESLL